MLKAYKFRLYPNQKQEKIIIQILGNVRFVYNHCLFLKNEKYKDGKQKFSFFSPLSIVEITTSNGHNKPLDSIKTVDLVYIPIRLKTDVRRQCIALFMAEALYKTLQHPMQDIPVYERLQYWIKQRFQLILQWLGLPLKVFTTN